MVVDGRDIIKLEVYHKFDNLIEIGDLLTIPYINHHPSGNT